MRRVILVSACGAALLSLPGCYGGADETIDAVDEDEEDPGNGMADGGSVMVVSRNSRVSLDGSAVVPDGEALGYTWTQVAGPDVTGARGTLDGVAPSFIAPNEVVTLAFELRVDDGEGPTAPTRVWVSVLEDANTALFVSGDTGDDELGQGTLDNPFASLSRALEAVTDAQQDIYLMSRAADARYDETAASLEIPAGTSLYGGYDDQWRRDVVERKTGVDSDHRGLSYSGAIDFDTWVSGIDLQAAGSSQPGVDVVGIFASGGAAALRIHDNVIRVGDVAAGAATSPGSSSGVQLHEIARVEVVDNQIYSGRGGDGRDGGDGQEGVPGANGSNGSGTGGGAPGSDSPGHDGGHGGGGGGGLSGSGGKGGDGEAAQGDHGFGGGSGVAGQPGANGADGGQGASGEGFGGNSDSASFIPAAGGDGVPGGHGGGGGGGGGGASAPIGWVGGGGGGGGGGGTGGDGGQGGGGGGASIGVRLVASSQAVIMGNVMVASDGGNGADGGLGASGASGGSGGSGAGGDCDLFGAVCGNNGASGGSGGNGGHGGHGGGGGGGPSFAVFVGANISPYLIGNVATAGDGGAGGQGAGDDNHGVGGWSFAVFDAATDDEAAPVLIDNELGAGVSGPEGLAGPTNF